MSACHRVFQKGARPKGDACNILDLFACGFVLRAAIFVCGQELHQRVFKIAYRSCCIERLYPRADPYPYAVE